MWKITRICLVIKSAVQYSMLPFELSKEGNREVHVTVYRFAHIDAGSPIRIYDKQIPLLTCLGRE